VGVYPEFCRMHVDGDNRARQQLSNVADWSLRTGCGRITQLEPAESAPAYAFTSTRRIHRRGDGSLHAREPGRIRWRPRRRCV